MEDSDKQDDDAILSPPIDQPSSSANINTQDEIPESPVFQKQKKPLIRAKWHTVKKANPPEDIGGTATNPTIQKHKKSLLLTRWLSGKNIIPPVVETSEGNDEEEHSFSTTEAPPANPVAQIQGKASLFSKWALIKQQNLVVEETSEEKGQDEKTPANPPTPNEKKVMTLSKWHMIKQPNPPVVGTSREKDADDKSPDETSQNTVAKNRRIALLLSKWSTVKPVNPAADESSEDKDHAEKIAANPVIQKYKRSIMLAKLLAAKPTNPSDVETANEEQDERSMQYGRPPPIEEPHCYSVGFCESVSTEGTNYSFQICKDTIRSNITEHLKNVGGRLQLLEDLEMGHITAKNVEELAEAWKPHEINVLLLYASFLGRGEVIPGLHKVGADLNHAEPEQGLTAMHLCAFSNSVVGVQYLMRNGADVHSMKVYTPFHYAAFGNSVNVAQYFLSEGVRPDTVQCKESVLHCAATSNALDVLRLIAPNNPALEKLDANGLAPIHHVADQGTSCLIVLLQAGCQVDLRSRKGDTALHIAAGAGCIENIELLIEKGANADARNQRSETPLHFAARAHFLDSVLTLLKEGNSNPNINDCDGRTPLHLAVGRSHLAFDVTNALITWKASVNRADRYGYTALHVAAVNELSQCVDLLIQNDADLSATTKGGTTALSIILRKLPSSLNVFKQRLDSAITLRHHGSATGEAEVRLDFHPLIQHHQRGEIGYMGTFVQEGFKEVLEHPLCQSFLYLKWQKIRKYYIMRLLMYLFYVLVFTAWVMDALSRNCYNETSNNRTDNSTEPRCDNTLAFYLTPEKHLIVLKVELYTLLVLTAFETLRKVTGIFTFASIWQFFTHVDNLLEWCVILGVFMTCDFNNEHFNELWQSRVGAFAVLFGWSNLMLMIGQFPIFGAYVAMFTSVQAQVFKLLSAYACLLFGFSVSFYVIFSHTRPFGSFLKSLFKILAMMTGELNYDDLFFPKNGEPSDSGEWFIFEASAVLCFTCFLLFVTIVLMNLLIGIAVDDIKGLQKSAGLAKLVRQTMLICDAESTLSMGLLPRRLMKMLRWSTLILPSAMRAVLTVRPLNPREKRLPPDVLASAYKVAKSSKSGKRVSSRKCRIVAKDDPPSSETDSAIYGHGNDDEEFIEEDKSLKDEITEIRRMCEQNQKLLMDLVTSAAMEDK